MATRTFRSWRPAALILLVGMALACVPILRGATAAPAPAAQATCRAASAQPNPAAPDLDCPAPPNTFDVTRYFSADSSPKQRALAGPTWDSWAWASFAAMSWPAKADSSQPTGFQRGVPDVTKSFAAAANDDVLVWETLKEKRELFQPTDTAPASKVTPESKWQDITFDSAQLPNSPANPGGIDACTPQDAARRKALGDGHHRLFSQGGKRPSVAGDQTFDETVEVASPALEASSELCAGYTATTNPTLDFCQTMLFPDNSKQNPIAVTGRTPVGPRVWKGNPKEASARPIFFEVKINYDYWDYILEKQFYDDSIALAAIMSDQIDDHPKLPFRTSASKGPGRSPLAAYGYDAGAVTSSYADLPDPNALPGIGSVQIKAGWLRLDPKQGDDPSEFHTTEAIFYRTKKDAPKTFPEDDALKYTCYEVADFGLLGLHIIQRVHAQPFSRDNPELFAHGGTFIFATWEHVGLGDYQQSSDFYYANYLAFNGPLGVEGRYPFNVQTTPFPNYTAAAGGAINVQRQQPYPLATTAKVNDAVHQQLAKQVPQGSLWANYRLIGTQFVTVSSEKDSEELNQPYYLANLVVETNDGLQNFHGLPPGVTVTPYYTQKVDIEGTSVVFEPNQPNVIFNRELNKPFNMGGCMGCHGVAQLKGYNFSFVFAGGQEGSGLDTQYHFAVAGGQAPGGETPGN